MKNFKYYMLFLPFLLFNVVQHDTNNTNQETLNFKPGVPILVGPENFNSAFSYYNTTPESPDGSMISYVKILTPQKKRYDKLKGELWVCKTNLTEHKKVIDVEAFQIHNGVNAQWIDNNTIAYCDDEYIWVVNLEGKEVIAPIKASNIGHSPFDKKILFSQVSEETKLWTIYEYDIFNNKQTQIADASLFSDIENHFSIKNIREITNRKIAHLQYSPDGSKIALRMDVGDDEINKHLVTFNKNGSDVKFFGSKPMHFAWYDNASIMGHDNQITDGLTNDKSCRRWSLDTKYIETLAGPGNHLAGSFNRDVYASESWYGENPVILRVFKKGQTTPFWQDTVSAEQLTVWKLGIHVNPSFSRDGKRVYYHKSLGFGKSQAYMVVLP